jgi:BMFP domain-containing protein YqiC
MQRASEAMKSQAEAALRVAEQSNAALQTRVEAAEAKLVQAIDEQVIDWSPAVQRLQEQSEKQMREMLQANLERLTTVYNSYRRRAERGYLGGDDINNAPPPDTPRDIENDATDPPA